MKTIQRAVSPIILGATFFLGTAACSDKFLTVTNPNVIDASTVNPTSGAGDLAASAQQNFATAYGNLIMNSAMFTGETLPLDTGFPLNEIADRTISELNLNLDGMLWRPISLAAALSKIVLDLALPNAASNIHIARAATFRGYSILFIATDFCTGALSSGPELSTSQLLDSAIFWFDKAINVGNANGTVDGKALANAALVGRARANLQKGNNATAMADATAVSAGYNFNMTYVDDVANRVRLSNRLWQGTFDRGTISVAPAYQVKDPRVRYLLPGQHTLNASDPAAGPFVIQQKYPAYNSPIRLASKLEAEYIAAEASRDVGQQLALINRQRLANAQPSYTGATDAASVLTELYNQRGVEFWLEGKRLADFRRQPTATLNVPATGTPFFKPGFPPIGNQTCYPLPFSERDNNPNMRKP